MSSVYGTKHDCLHSPREREMVREDNFEILKEPYRAIMKKDLDAVKRYLITHSHSYCYCVCQENRNGKQRLKIETNESSDVLLKKRIN